MGDFTFTMSYMATKLWEGWANLGITLWNSALDVITYFWLLVRVVIDIMVIPWVGAYIFFQNGDISVGLVYLCAGFFQISIIIYGLYVDRHHQSTKNEQNKES